MSLKPISEEYHDREFRIRPRDRLHRLVARLCDTWIDDLTDERITELERVADDWRITHGDGNRFTA